MLLYVKKCIFLPELHNSHIINTAVGNVTERELNKDNSPAKLSHRIKNVTLFMELILDG